MKKITILIVVLILALAIPVLKGKIGKEKTTPPTKQENTISPQTKNGAKTTPAVSYYYPISDFVGRIKIKSYGTLVKPGDEKKEICGAAFSGYHTGDDLETIAAEANKAVAIKSIAAGTVRESGSVSGYGGLVVIEHNLAGRVVTAYYGHLNLNSVKLKTGQKVTAGEVIGNLGQGCSAQTGFERKHLHFAIHQGSAIDVRGYVPTLNLLAAWADPLKEIKNLKGK